MQRIHQPGWNHRGILKFNPFHPNPLPTGSGGGGGGGWFWKTTWAVLYMSEKCQGKFKFFQGQGIVREFFDMSGKNEILQKCQGNVRKFYISACWNWDVWSRCFLFANFIKFSAPVPWGKFEFVSGNCLGILVSPKCLNPEFDHEIYSTVILSFPLIQEGQLGVVGSGNGVVYLTSPGRPTEIGLQLGKACYPCSR